MTKNHVPWLALTSVGIFLVVMYSLSWVNKPAQSPPLPAPIDNTQIMSAQPSPFVDSQSEASAAAEQNLKPQLKSTKELPEIAAVVMKQVIGEDAMFIPSVSFLSNDGEYASVRVGDSGGMTVYLVRSENQWTIFYKGEVPGDCAEILPVRKKYTLNKEFLPCKGEK